MAKNFAYGTVLTAPSPATSGTSLVLNSAQGALFPPVPFNATIWPVGVQPTSSNAEVVTVTAISTDTLTITRAQEDSSARTVIIGDQVAATITANSIVQLNRFISQTATQQNITLDASTDFLASNLLEIGSTYSFEVPATSTVEVAAYAPQSGGSHYSSQIQSMTNSGSAGGTMYWLNLGGLKILWGVGATQSVGTGGGTFNFTLPSFFITLHGAFPTVGVITTTLTQSATLNSAPTTSTIAVDVIASVNGSTCVPQVIVIGT